MTKKWLGVIGSLLGWWASCQAQDVNPSAGTGFVKPVLLVPDGGQGAGPQSPAGSAGPVNASIIYLLAVPPPLPANAPGATPTGLPVPQPPTPVTNNQAAGQPVPVAPFRHRLIPPSAAGPGSRVGAGCGPAVLDESNQMFASEQAGTAPTPLVQPEELHGPPLPPQTEPEVPPGVIVSQPHASPNPGGPGQPVPPKPVQAKAMLLVPVQTLQPDRSAPIGYLQADSSSPSASSIQTMSGPVVAGVAAQPSAYQSGQVQMLVPYLAQPVSPPPAAGQGGGDFRRFPVGLTAPGGPPLPAGQSSGEFRKFPAGPPVPVFPPSVSTKEVAPGVSPDAAGWGNPAGSDDPDLGQRFYVSGEYLLWWTKGSPLPPLLTTTTAVNPNNPSASGAIGLPNTQVLVGDQSAAGGPRSGGRLMMGYWLGEDRRFGFEMGGFVLQTLTNTYSGNSGGLLPLYRPIFNPLTGNEGVVVVASPRDHWGATGDRRQLPGPAHQFLLGS